MIPLHRFKFIGSDIINAHINDKDILSAIFYYGVTSQYLLEFYTLMFLQVYCLFYWSIDVYG